MSLMSHLSGLLLAIESRPPWWRPVKRLRWYRALRARATKAIADTPALALERVLADRYRTDGLNRVDHVAADPTVERVIDARPCDPLTDADCNWGEQDSLANVPRRNPLEWAERRKMAERQEQIDDAIASTLRPFE